MNKFIQEYNEFEIGIRDIMFLISLFILTAAISTVNNTCLDLETAVNNMLDTGHTNTYMLDTDGRPVLYRVEYDGRRGE